MKIKKKQQIVKKWFFELQKLICNNIEELEKTYGSNKKFKKNKWKYGEFRIIEGEVIDIQEDDVIFFNDKDIHWTQKNKSNEDRITISFNMRWHSPLIYNV